MVQLGERLTQRPLLEHHRHVLRRDGVLQIPAQRLAASEGAAVHTGRKQAVALKLGRLVGPDGQVEALDRLAPLREIVAPAARPLVAVDDPHRDGRSSGHLTFPDASVCQVGGAVGLPVDGHGEAAERARTPGQREGEPDGGRSGQRIDERVLSVKCPVVVALAAASGSVYKVQVCRHLAAGERDVLLGLQCGLAAEHHVLTAAGETVPQADDVGAAGVLQIGREHLHALLSDAPQQRGRKRQGAGVGTFGQIGGGGSLLHGLGDVRVRGVRVAGIDLTAQPDIDAAPGHLEHHDASTQGQQRQQAARNPGGVTGEPAENGLKPLPVEQAEQQQRREQRRQHTQNGDGQRQQRGKSLRQQSERGLDHEASGLSGTGLILLYSNEYNTQSSKVAVRK